MCSFVSAIETCWNGKIGFVEVKSTGMLLVVQWQNGDCCWLLQRSPVSENHTFENACRGNWVAHCNQMLASMTYHGYKLLLQLPLTYHLDLPLLIWLQPIWRRVRLEHWPWRGCRVHLGFRPKVDTNVQSTPIIVSALLFRHIGWTTKLLAMRWAVGMEPIAPWNHRKKRLNLNNN